MTNEEWREEAVRLFGEDARVWAFRCPRCGNEASVGDFEQALKGSGHRAPHECIGRVLAESGAGPSFEELAADPQPKPCDWAAFGLLDLPGTLTIADGTRAFPFAA